MRNAFEQAVTALCHSFIREHYGARAGVPGPAWERTVRFVLAQHARMPDYLRLPFLAATLVFNYGAIAAYARPFHRLQEAPRWRHIAFMRRLGPFRDLMRFYEGLSVFGFGEELERGGKGFPAEQASFPPSPAIGNKAHRDIVVIGSGPGGSMTACLLAEAGRDVLLIESGPFLSLDQTPEFSREEMERKYRNGGITAAFGRTKVSYVEGNCAGGSSEINAGLYHRTPDDMLARWREEFGLETATPADMLPHFEANERELGVGLFPGEHPAASLKLHQGAERMGWKSMEVPRWYKYENGHGQKQSMSRSFLPRSLKAGCEFLPGMRVRRLHRHGTGWTVDCEAADAASGTHRISCETVFVCAGAIQTASLLLASGVGNHVGASLRMHPTVKVVAQFPETVNSHDMGVTVHQVKEFSPRLSFGVSISRAPYISLAMLDHPAHKSSVNENWPRMAIYYAMITGGNGRVRTPPYYHDALVSYALDETDMRNLAEGVAKLSEMMFAAGAERVYPTVTGFDPLLSRNDIRALPEQLPAGRSSLMSVHLFSSCPMGENRNRCTADSFGKVHSANNLYINDASLLCTAPGVNPQGSVMAFARRNVMNFLSRQPGNA